MSRAVLQPFETYQKARVQFVQTVAELAIRSQNIEALQAAGKIINRSKKNKHYNDKVLILNYFHFFFLNKIYNY